MTTKYNGKVGREQHTTSRPWNNSALVCHNYHYVSLLSPEKALEPVPRQAIKNVCSLQTSPPRLIEAAAH